MDFDLLSTEISCFFERISGQRCVVLTKMNDHLMLELFIPKDPDMLWDFPYNPILGMG